MKLETKSTEKIHMLGGLIDHNSEHSRNHKIKFSAYQKITSLCMMCLGVSRMPLSAAIALLGRKSARNETPIRLCSNGL